MSNTKLSENDLLNILMQLEQQAGNMVQSARMVESIRQEITIHFQAEASTVFQGKIDEWEGRYNMVRAAYDQLYESLDQATQGMGHAHNNAMEAAGAIGVSTDVMNGLLKPPGARSGA